MDLARRRTYTMDFTSKTLTILWGKVNGILWLELQMRTNKRRNTRRREKLRQKRQRQKNQHFSAALFYSTIFPHLTIGSCCKASFSFFSDQGERNAVNDPAHSVFRGLLLYAMAYHLGKMSLDRLVDTHFASCIVLDAYWADCI